MSDSRIPLPARDPVSRIDPKTDNGRVPASYPQTVSPKKPPSKADIEAQLQIASDSISTRVQAIQDEFNLTTDAVRSFFGSPLIAILATLGAGLIVGRLLGGGSKKESRASDPDAFASLLIREVDEALDAGKSPDEAIHRVIDAVGNPDLGASKSSASALKWVAGLALRSVLSQGIKAATSARSDSGDPAIDNASPEEGND